MCARVHVCVCSTPSSGQSLVVCCSMCGACPWECMCVFLRQIRTLSQVRCRRLLINRPPSEERWNLLFLIAERFYHTAMWTFTEFCSGACWENHVFCYYFSCWQGEWVINFPRAAGLCAPRSSSWAQGIPFHLHLLLALLWIFPTHVWPDLHLLVPVGHFWGAQTPLGFVPGHGWAERLYIWTHYFLPAEKALALYYNPASGWESPEAGPYLRCHQALRGAMKNCLLTPEAANHVQLTTSCSHPVPLWTTCFTTGPLGSTEPSSLFMHKPH